MTLIAADSAPGERWCRSCCCWGTVILCAVLRAGLESHGAELWAHPGSKRHGGRDTSALGDRRHRACLELWLRGEQSRPQSQPLARPQSSSAPAPSRLQGNLQEPGGTREPSCCLNPALAQPLLRIALPSPASAACSWALPPPAPQAGPTLPSSFPACSGSLSLAAPQVPYLTSQFCAEEELPLLLLQQALSRKARTACTQRGQPRSARAPPPLGSKGLRELGWKVDRNNSLTPVGRLRFSLIIIITSSISLLTIPKQQREMRTQPPASPASCGPSPAAGTRCSPAPRSGAGFPPALPSTSAPASATGGTAEKSPLIPASNQVKMSQVLIWVPRATQEPRRVLGRWQALLLLPGEASSCASATCPCLQQY